ncbi:BREX-2 system adenine-specific DNA-methyltransferase PglX [Streptomyces sp. NPDC088190]|uniref:BREX-2 system adenine-specific DNA-methyltransferase PglX n=1 Tax=unclassified Streptomyces TaxID=2593676 RepID=UPI002E77C347|nr:BREX-2 system adenine-specific DNA-methyltransferase PglX [Streptomyces sp. JV190]MEE1841911.1 BREX-2 system adenine-specific DNA-methyltransferase PglX [Streptomyces sp. JV190]
MIDRTALKTDLIKQVKAVEVDLGKQVAEGEKVLKPLRTEYVKTCKAVAPPDEAPKWEDWLSDRLAELPAERADAVRAAEAVAGRLRSEYDEARGLGRTAATWNAWLDERVTQVAVAWVLGTVFVRFCEDNRLIPDPYLTGPEQERRDLAEARYAQYVEETEDPTYRGWLLRAFDELGAGQAGKLLFRQDRNPLYQIPLSHDGARALVEFWRERREAPDSEGGESGAGGALILVHDFTDPLNEDGTEGWDTRFLGDLYQDLSEAARKTYALLQTPEFVEEFILDRTMDPVVRELGGRFGELKMIDPTCGSGHFVLGAFRRLVRLSAERQPGRDRHERVRDALNSVHGVDINPFAVAIARFRLLLAAMAAANVRTLADAGRYDWPIHLAVGDSLIQDRQQELELISVVSGKRLVDFAYATEDLDDYPGILERGRYDVVVGNPPYITVKDKKLNALYRRIYDSCSGRYALSVPFAERFFQLAKTGDPNGHGYGMVGQITANSFMKREFGAKLIEEYFAYKVELKEVIDTSGAYIPGHGTPTVILIGKRRTGSGRSETIRTVRSIQGEPGSPGKAEDGRVWTSIVDQIDRAGSVSSWVSVDDLDRNRYFAKQPWILADGGLELNEAIETSSDAILKSKLSRDIGFASFPGQDDSFISTPQALHRGGVSPEVAMPLIVGETVRDWDTHCTESAIAPYGKDLKPLPYDGDSAWGRLLWTTRSHLRSTRDFDGQTQQDLGKPWWAWYRWVPDRYRTPLTITFAFVSTHNHFVLDRGGKVFKQTSPVIKLHENASETEYLQLLGLLNSSTSCFWLQQVSHNKGEGGGARVEAGYAAMGSEAWKNSFEFSGGKVEHFPLPARYPTSLPQALDGLAKQLATSSAGAMALNSGTTVTTLREAKKVWRSIRAQMIALQEELDWQVYSLYKLHSEDLRAPKSEVPELALGERAFEIVLARRVEKGEASREWFERHGSTPITEMPDHWSDAYKAVVQKRIDVIESSRAIGMVERPEYKRRWATEGWDVLQERALESWLLDRMENRELWFQDGQPTLLTRTQLTSALALDEDFVSVAELYAPRKELATVVAELLADEHVPFLPALRYKPSGLKKRADWEHVWELQREEDTAPDEPAKRKIRDTISVPPKYTSADFLKPSYWRARGKLDVPKERFISYATGSISGVPDLFGWAGWDHREQAQALTTYFTNDDGLSSEEMVPLLAGLLELQPWLGQWHNEFDPLYSGTPAAFFAGYRSAQQGEHGLTDDDLRAWRPAPAARRGRRPAGG